MSELRILRRRQHLTMGLLENWLSLILALCVILLIVIAC